MLSSKPRFCFLIFSLEGGGLQHFLLRFIKYLNYKAEVLVVVKGPVSGDLLDSFKENRVNLVFIKTGYLNFISWFKIYRLLKGKKFQAICDLTSNFAGVYMLLGKIAKVPNRIAYYGQNSNHFIESRFNLFYNAIVNSLVRRFSTAIVSNSINALNFFFGKNWVQDSRFKVIDNGIDINEFGRTFNLRESLGIPINAFIVGHSGRLDIKKNHGTILKVAFNLISNNSDIYFILCGKGTGILKEEVQKMGLESRIYILDFRDDMPLVYNSMDLFYFPSYSEGQSNALIEAMISGLPVVASNIESNREALPGLVHKFMVEPNNIQEAVNAIISIKTNPEKYPVHLVSEWAKERYNAQFRFHDFFSILVKN